MVGIPFHSSKMESIREDILRSLSFVDESNSLPSVPVVSTVKAIVEGSFDKYPLKFYMGLFKRDSFSKKTTLAQGSLSPSVLFTSPIHFLLSAI
jgi:hypothetical protein